jgi:recombination protein RecA
MIYGSGVSRTGEIIDLAVDNDIIKKSGSWFSYGEDRIGQGKDKVSAYLEENPALLKDIEKKVRELYGI